MSVTSEDFRPFLKRFILRNGLELKKDPVTGRDLVDVADLDLALRRGEAHKQTRQWEKKAPLEEILTEIVEKAIIQFEDNP